MQPDSIIPDQTNPQSWNRFSYVTNRPINMNDPSGHIGEGCPVGESCGIADNLITMLLLALFNHADRIELTGNAIDMIQEDPVFRDFQGDILQEQVFGNPSFGKSEIDFSVTRTLQFGGDRDTTPMLIQLFDMDNPEYEETRQVGRNPLTWMVRTADITAKGHVTKDGRISINYSLEDTFDLRWENDRELLYNIIASGLGSVWHDGLGATEPKVNANWTVKIPITTLPIRPERNNNIIEIE